MQLIYERKEVVAGFGSRSAGGLCAVRLGTARVLVTRILWKDQHTLAKPLQEPSNLSY
jgi:hypothetical protein